MRLLQATQFEKLLVAQRILKNFLDVSRGHPFFGGDIET